MNISLQCGVGATQKISENNKQLLTDVSPASIHTDLGLMEPDSPGAACSWMCGFIPVFRCLLVYVMLSCTFRYGRQDMDVMGVAFRRDLFLVTRQVYPELQDKEKLTHTKIQQKLLRKLGNNAFPFFFEVRNSLERLERSGPARGRGLITPSGSRIENRKATFVMSGIESFLLC